MSDLVKTFGGGGFTVPTTPTTTAPTGSALPTVPTSYRNPTPVPNAPLPFTVDQMPLRQSPSPQAPVPPPPAAPPPGFAPNAPWNPMFGGAYQGYNPGMNVAAVGNVFRGAAGAGGGGGFQLPVGGGSALAFTAPGQNFNNTGVNDVADIRRALLGDQGV